MNSDICYGILCYQWDLNCSSPNGESWSLERRILLTLMPYGQRLGWEL